MVDVFEEVEEQIRAERYKALGLKLLPWAIGAGVAAVIFAGGLWGWDAWSTSQGDKAAKTYIEAMKAREQGDETKAFTLLGEVAKAPVKGYPVMALMSQAGMRLNAGKTDEAVALLGSALRGGPERRITVDEIQKTVAEHFSMKQADLLSERRTRAVARPRQIAMYLCKQHTTRSYPDIGRRFGGRDHTTVLHGVRKIEELLATDDQIARDVEALTRKLRG